MYSSIATRLWLLLIFAAISCVKEDFPAGNLDTNIQLKPALAVPLGFFEINLTRDLKVNENARLTINRDHIICLKYYGEFVSEPARNMFRFERISENINLPHPTGNPVNLSLAPYFLNFPVKVPVFISNTGVNAKIDQIIIANGAISLSEIRFPSVWGEAVITIENLKINEQHFQTRLTPGMDNYMSDLSGYTLGLSNSEDRNNLVELEINISFPAQDNILNGNEPLLEVNLEMEIEDWNELSGYMGEETIQTGRSTFSVDLHDFFSKSEIYFKEPVLKIKTLNSFSVPFGLSFSNVSAITAESGNVAISGPGVPVAPGYFLPAYPGHLELPGVEADSLILNSENSNLNTAISSSPTAISCQVDLTTNPGDEKIPNVILADSRFSTILELELPFYGNAKNIILKDTLEIDLSKINLPDNEEIQKVTFKLYYENSVPADISFQVSLADQNQLITETLFDTFKKINPAPASDKYSDKPPFVSGQLEAIFPGNRLENIIESKFMIGEVIINTNSPPEHVKIFKNQGFNVNLGVIFEIETSVDDL